MELLPLPGEALSMTEIEKRLSELEQEFQACLLYTSSQREAAEEYGVCQGTIKYRAKEIRKNLKFLLLKSEKSSQ